MWIRIASLSAVLVLWPGLGPATRAQALHDLHRGAGMTCAACHIETPATVAPPDAVCVACHGTMIGDDAPVFAPDPHRSPHLGPGETPACNDCHKVHRKPEVTCVTCHRGFQFDLD